eukprot:TRINITY_DN95973_c0_g1_i1.p1 TRINITY_DN95973_c0_g1~~TRINITY_DN95973_c0_g1_i1.p1  ORF type:complete len:372 (-),score=99.19 TRINITY_DN95973_c0_g1_i1:15-1130(-)
MGRSPRRSPRRRSPRRSRSRSRGGRGGGGGSRRENDRTSARDRRGSVGGRDQGRLRNADREERPSDGRSRTGSRDGEAISGEANTTASLKTGKEKAKEAMEKEREKARLKREERENAQKQKQQNKQDQREKKREETALAIAQVVDESAAKAKQAGSPAGGLKIAAQSESEQKAEAAKAMSAAERAAEAAKGIASRLGKKGPAAISEEDARKLFELMDRSSKGQVSQRDVLVALRKHHAVRQLFGLAGSAGEEASALENRLMTIQEAFEAGSGLGEVAPLFKELKEAGSASQAFEWEPFLKACTSGTLKARAVQASASLPREHSHGAAFVATKEWALVPPGAACPAGLEYRMDMETGQTLARLAQKKVDKDA